MNWSRIASMILLAATTPLSVQAGLFFNKSEKAAGADRVSVLITTLKSDPSDSKRSSAAEALRRFDPSANPQIVPALVESAMSDPKAGVRLEALQSLSRLRPVSQQAGWALEQAAGNDSSMINRMRVRTMLWQYHLSGYRSGQSVQQPGPGGYPVLNTSPGTPSTFSQPQVIVEQARQPRSKPMSKFIPSFTNPGRAQGTPTVQPMPVLKPAPGTPTTAEPPLLQPPVPINGPDLNMPK